MASLAQTVQTKVSAHSRTPVLLALAAAIAAALLQSLFVPIDCDVSWLITVNEKLLSGLRPYIDVLEPNPPASIWLYTPAVWAAHQLQVRPEAMVAAAFIAGALASCAAVVRTSSRLNQPPNAALLAASACFVTLILPLGTFAQREHAALLLALPALAGLAVLADGRTLPLPTRVALGIAAGLVIVIKPHFALAIAIPAAFAWSRSRTLRPMLAPAAAAALTVSLYGAAVAIFTPQYLQLVPMLTEIYLPMREHWSTLLRGPVFVVPLACLALVLTLRPGRLDSLAAMFLLGCAGFTLAALLQMKGYLNHALPAMALGFAAVALAVAVPQAERKRAVLVGVAGALLAALQLYAMASIQPLPGLRHAVERVAPAHPRVIALSPDLLTGHPLVRNVEGTWAGSRPALFVAAGAYRQLGSGRTEARSRLQAWYQQDVQTFASDIMRNAPDVVLVDARPETAWLRRHAVVAAAMSGYRPAARAGDIQVWIRR